MAGKKPRFLRRKRGFRPFAARLAEAPRAARRGTYSPSAAVWHAGVTGDLPAGAEHHNIHFGEEWEPAFRALMRDGVRMPDPSLLVSVPSIADASIAPPGAHVLYVLEPVPNLDGAVDWVAGLYAFTQEVETTGTEEYGADAAYWLIGASVPANLLDGYAANTHVRSSTESKSSWPRSNSWRTFARTRSIACSQTGCARRPTSTPMWNCHAAVLDCPTSLNSIASTGRAPATGMQRANAAMGAKGVTSLSA